MESAELLPFASYAQAVDVSDADVMIIDLEVTAAGDSPKAALLTVEALTANGDLQPLDGWWQSEEYGQFQYLTTEDGSPVHHQFIIEVPKAVTCITFRGVQWSKALDVQLVGQPAVNIPGTTEQTSRLPSGTPICLPSEYLNTIVEVPASARHLEATFGYSAPAGTPRVPVTVNFLDAAGAILPPPEGLLISEAIGTYIYLDPSDSNSRLSVSLTVPKEVKSIQFVGTKWGSAKLTLQAEPDVEWNKIPSPLDDVRDFIRAIPADTRLWVVDTTAPPIGDETRALRPNNMVKALSEEGEHAIFLPFTSIQDQPASPLPHTYQLDRKYYSDLFNLIVDERPNSKNIYACSSFPSLQAVATIDLLKESNWKTIYVIRDDMEEFNRAGYSKWYTPALERRMLASVDQVVTVSPALAQKAKILQPSLTAEVTVMPNAVRRSTVDRNSPVRAASLWNSRSKKVGYVGHLTPSWFDWQLVIYAAKRLPEINFELIGHGFPTGMRLPENVEYLGAKTHEELEHLAHDWRVGLIPFVPSPLSVGVDPNKLFEYAAWGLRTVSAPMGSVGSAPSTFVYRTAEELSDHILQAVSTEMTDEEMSTLDRFAKTNTWTERAKSYIDMVESL